MQGAGGRGVQGGCRVRRREGGVQGARGCSCRGRSAGGGRVGCRGRGCMEFRGYGVGSTEQVQGLRMRVEAGFAVMAGRVYRQAGLADGVYTL